MEDIGTIWELVVEVHELVMDDKLVLGLFELVVGAKLALEVCEWVVIPVRAYGGGCGDKEELMEVNIPKEVLAKNVDVRASVMVKEVVEKMNHS